MIYISFSETDTEKSEFCSIEVLDETADSKATVLKILNILHKKFQIGIKLQYQVVVGDRKSYDHLIKLKSEYGGSLSWVLPYHGYWHILFLISFSIKLIIHCTYDLFNFHKNIWTFYSVNSLWKRNTLEN